MPLEGLNHYTIRPVDLARTKEFYEDVLGLHVGYRPPLNFPATQITELSDGIPSGPKTTRAHSTQKSVIETTIKDFVDSSREQDRLFLLYAGHAVALDDKAYLVPIDGNIKDVDSLVPLKWVYDQLAACKARQKLLILDVYRFPPARGFELPGAGADEDGLPGVVIQLVHLLLSTGGVDLHVVADLVGEQVPVVGGQDDRLDAEVAEHPHAPPQVAEHAVHLEPGLCDVVGLAQFVDLLRGHEHQPGVLDALLHLRR